MQHLVVEGADKEKATITGLTPLVIAIMRGDLEMVQYLIQRGADKNKANNDGGLPLLIAAQHGH